MKPRDVEILQHSLGLDRDHREPWRNYYCAEDGDTELETLVAMGLMKRCWKINEGRDRIYRVTLAGEHIAIAALPKPRSRAQQRYRRFLNAQDAYTDLTFREFLRMEAAR